MVLKSIHPTDSTDVWGTLTVGIPANYQHPAVHLQAQTTMQKISIQDAENLITNTPADTAYPRPDNSPALLIWQLPGLNGKVLKAVEAQVSGRHTKFPSTTTLTNTCNASTNFEHTRPSTSLLLHVLTHATSAHDGMNLYVHATQYDIQIALQGTIKQHYISMERNIL